MSLLAVPSPAAMIPVPSPILGRDLSSSALSSASDHSSTNSSGLAMLTALEPEIESQLSTQILQLTLDRNRSLSADSFSSEPDSNFNKGAGAFLALVQDVLEKREN